MAEKSKGVNCLVFRDDFFDRTVDANGMKTADAKENVWASWTMIINNTRLRNNWVEKGTEFAGQFWEIFNAQRINTHQGWDGECVYELSIRSSKKIFTVTWKKTKDKNTSTSCCSFSQLQFLKIIAWLISDWKMLKNLIFSPIFSENLCGSQGNQSWEREIEFASTTMTRPSKGLKWLLQWNFSKNLAFFYQRNTNVHDTKWSG